MDSGKILTEALIVKDEEYDGEFISFRDLADLFNPFKLYNKCEDDLRVSESLFNLKTKFVSTQNLIEKLSISYEKSK